MNTDNEAIWVTAARRGERWALEQLYSQNASRVYALCYRVLDRVEDAQDATQSTFLHAFQGLAGYRGEGPIRRWLYRIAVNEALAILRRRRSTLRLEEECASCPDAAPAVEQRLAIQSALHRLRPAHKAILVLRYWEELSYEEIAEVLNISLSATKMRLLRAREEFQQCYEDG